MFRTLCHKCLLILFFLVTTTTETYTLSLHDALPIYTLPWPPTPTLLPERTLTGPAFQSLAAGLVRRSEEHTSELQSRLHLVCRLLLEKKNTNRTRSSLITTSVPLTALRLLCNTLILT